VTSPAIGEVAENLAVELDQKLFVEKQYSQVILICHSLGGIICFDYLHHVVQRKSHKYASLFGLTIKLGTPMGGSGLSWYVETVSRNPQWRVLSSHGTDYRSLMTRAIDAWGEKRLACTTKLQFHAAAEQKVTWYNAVGVPIPLGVLVPSSSAWHKFSTSTKEFDTDHIQLVKPADRTTDIYRWVKEAVSACIGGVSMCPRTTKTQCPGPVPPWVGIFCTKCFLPHLAPSTASSASRSRRLMCGHLHLIRSRSRTSARGSNCACHRKNRLMEKADQDRLFAELDSLGQDEVHRRKALGAYGEQRLPTVEEWLRRQDTKR